MKRFFVLLLACSLLLMVSGCDKLGLSGPEKAKPSLAVPEGTIEVPTPEPSSSPTESAQAEPRVEATMDPTRQARSATRTAIVFTQQTKLAQYTLTAEAQSSVETGTPTGPLPAGTLASTTVTPTATITPTVTVTATATITPTVTATHAATIAPTATVVATTRPRPTSYVVQRGDTLYRLALRFHVRTETLAAANSISYPYDIQVGQTLAIPPEDGWVSATLYTVRVGDSLFLIAQAWGLDWRDLARANGLYWPYRIYVGQELIIPVSRPESFTPPVLTPSVPTGTASPTAMSVAPTSTATEVPAPTPTPLAGWTVYNIHTGDFSFHYPGSWAVTPDTVNVSQVGPGDRLVVRPAGTSGILGNEGGVLVIGMHRSDPAALLEFWQDQITSLLPGSSQASSIDIAWNLTETTQLSGHVSKFALGSMTVKITGEPDTVMRIWLGAVVYGGRNYGLYFKSPEGEWAITYSAVCQIMIDTFTLK